MGTRKPTEAQLRALREVAARGHGDYSGGMSGTLHAATAASLERHGWANLRIVHSGGRELLQARATPAGRMVAGYVPAIVTSLDPLVVTDEDGNARGVQLTRPGPAVEIGTTGWLAQYLAGSRSYWYFHAGEH